MCTEFHTAAFVYVAFCVCVGVGVFTCCVRPLTCTLCQHMQPQDAAKEVANPVTIADEPMDTIRYSFYPQIDSSTPRYHPQPIIILTLMFPRPLAPTLAVNSAYRDVGLRPFESHERIPGGQHYRW